MSFDIGQEEKENIAVGMFDRGLLGFPEEGITLKSGRNSPYYYNDRISLSYSRELDNEGTMSIERQRDFVRSLCKGFGKVFQGLEQPVDHVFGKAQAGTAPVAVGAYEAGISYLWERVDEPNKQYGNHQKIEGTYQEGELVAIGDDVVTNGKSKIEGAKVLTNVGLIPTSVAIKFDRQEGGFDPLIEEGYEVASLMDLSSAVIFLADNNRIGSREFEALDSYHQTLRNEGINSTYISPK